MPMIMVLMLVRFFGKDKSWRAVFEVLPFALFAGVSVTIPFVLTGIFLGPEFPALMGGLVGLAIVTTAARKGFLIPKTTWDFADRKDWPQEWLGSIEMKLEELTDRPMSSFRAWSPYLLVAVLLVAVLLVVSRVFPEVTALFKSVSVSFGNLLGEADIGAGIQP
ncbi:MAG: lactate permease, partial [Marinobacter psychrophilus]